MGDNGPMPSHVLFAILIVLGFVVAACAVMAVLAWGLVAYFRAREKKHGVSIGSDQSPVIADGLFTMDTDAGLLTPDANPARH